MGGTCGTVSDGVFNLGIHARPKDDVRDCALCLHLSAPRCDECMSWSMDERIEEETMTLLPLKRMP